MAEVLSNVKILLPILMVIFRAYVESKGTGTPENARQFVLPAIFWDPRNPLFNCPSRGINTINVRMLDYLSFACPLDGRNLEWQTELQISYTKRYENAWLLTDKTAALNCNASAQTGKPFIECKPTSAEPSKSIRISKYAEAPGDPTFTAGTTYYVIGTGTGAKSTQFQKVGGRCSGYSDGTEVLYNLTLRIHVCSLADQNTERCPICLDTACYEKGCGLYGPWQAPTYHRNISSLWLNDIDSTVIQDSTVQAENKCYRVKERICDDVSRGCNGSSREIKVVECPKVYVNSTGGCTEWKIKPEIYRNETNGCFQINYRECIVGSLERYNKTEWKMVTTSCPTTLPLPTTLTPKKGPFGAKQKKGDDEKSYLIYTVAACTFFVGVILGCLIMVVFKKIKAGDSSRIHDERCLTHNGCNAESNHTANTVLSPGMEEGMSHELDSLKRKSTIALTKSA